MEWGELCRDQFMLSLRGQEEASGLNLTVTGSHWSILIRGMIYSVYVLRQRLWHLHCDSSVRERHGGQLGQS